MESQRVCRGGHRTPRRRSRVVELDLRKIGAVRLGEEIRKQRKRFGISQASLSLKTGIHRPNISRLEAGKHLPTLDTLRRVAEALDVSPMVFLQGWSEE